MYTQNTTNHYKMSNTRLQESSMWDNERLQIPCCLNNPDQRLRNSPPITVWHTSSSNAQSTSSNPIHIHASTQG